MRAFFCTYNPFRYPVQYGLFTTPMKRKFTAMVPAEKNGLKVVLTPVEERLRKLLVDAANDLSEKDAVEAPVVLRWAGGWVRDKLLGAESDDIDTAINSMTGEQFTMALVEFCARPEVAEKHGITSEDIGHLATIKKNPEKSKNLETATVRLLGLECDFVNLRKETYARDSRNPEVEFGTAEEDAERRDATVNALFFNIHNCEVEDFTGGLADLKAKLIRTPLEPFQTFMDDPLRVLRLVRFASRLKFSIDPKAEAVMGDSRVLDALRLKISRERVGVELGKMLKGKHPLKSLELIDRLGLYHTIFTDPTQLEMEKPDTSRWSVVYKCVYDLSQNATPGCIWKVLARCGEDEYFAWATAAILPWEFVSDPKPPKKKGSYPQTVRVAREGFRATNKFCEMIAGASTFRDEIRLLKKAVCEKAEFVSERDRFGMAIRRWNSFGGAWRLRVLATAFFEIMEETRSLQHPTAETLAAKVSDILVGWQEFLDHLEDLDVMEAPSLKRIIQGTELANALGVKPGQWMTQALDICVAWQLRNPEATDALGAIEEVRKRSEQLGIRPTRT
ncbi:hypothetical protein MKZ38_005351 [Zalerion maritima]|uniref:tRNA nucleotidyltransferase n=1 Tax=Zalerion maritima TaxID=339359 RepID=A0AAD5RY36_9PEZI|nr:hypothetical protein MKZ38_005351 [Zalerion maritima]